jgi:hypothetical protein
MARGLFAALACALIALAALPACAAAQRPEVHPGGFSVVLELPEQDGWEMSITAENHRQIYFNATRGAMEVKYRVAGRASSRLLEADFGPLGRVDLKLNLEPKPLPSFLLKMGGARSDRCRGRNPVEMEGRYRGEVEFAGDPSVPDVEVNKGSASLSRSFRRVCKPFRFGPAADHSPDIAIRLNLLAARAHSGGRTTTFEAAQVGVPALFVLGIATGSVHERLDRVRIIRSAIEIIESGDLHFSPLTKAVQRVGVQPPPPFTGRASYLGKRNAAGTWTGDLAVRPPGAGAVALAGPLFEGAICGISELSQLSQLKKCLLKVRSMRPSLVQGPLLAALYGSGSHSQPLALARLSSLR